MSKYRIYELAKEFSTTSKVIIDILARNNMVAKNHMSSVDDDAKAIVSRTFARKTNVPEQSAGGHKPASAKEQQSIAKPSNENKTSASPQSAAQRPYNSQRQQQYSQPQRNHSNQQKQQTNSYQQTRPTNNQAPRSSQNQRNYGQGTQQRPSQNQQHPSQQRSANSGFRNQQQRPDHNKPVAAGQSQQNQRTQTNTNTSNSNNNTGNGNKRQQNFHNQNRPQGRYSQNRQQSQHSSRHHSRPAAAAPVKTEHPTPKMIKLGGPVTVKDLAGKIGREVGEVIKKLMMLGVMASINQEVDLDTATILAGEFGTKVEELPPEEDPTEIPEIEDDPSTLVLRPPVVTVMGHVDHGKTSLLDAIRQTHVTAHEAGGITQHIGAYQVISQGKKIVFLDTPGHEAFTAMRARGAQVTDIAILVVAADDGVMPQTIEAINHAKSAKVPIIVAINKMDRPGANPDRVKQQLGEHGLIPEDWGGDTIMVPVSAHKKTGITALLEMVLLVAEMQEIKANPNRAALGTIIEAQLDKGRGPVATVLVQKGTLRIGDSIIAGTAYGKVRAMLNDRGEKVKKAEPSTPVEVLGLADVPAAGDILAAVDEKVARSVAEKRIAKKRTDELMQSQKVSLDDLFKQIQEGNIKDLNIVVKADVQGSIEALRQSLLALNTDSKEVRVSIVHAGVGAINESDVLLASAANALIIGFNVRPDANARKAAETEKIDIRTYRVIYEAINDVQAAMTGMLAPEYKEVIQGRVEIRKVFTISKAVIAGAYVLEGKIASTSKIRIIRDGIVVHEGELESLRRFKDDVKEVAAGYECGISVEKYRDLKEGDVIEVYAMEEVKPNS